MHGGFLIVLFSICSQNKIKDKCKIDQNRK